jgi:hypothetical protein
VRWSLLLVLLLGTGSPLALAQQKEANFRAGFAERDITPKIGSEAPGGYAKSYHKSIHDPCKVRASVFDDGKTTVAIVGIDALFIHRQTVLKVRKQIHDKTGIPENNILLAASHSHSSGPMCGVLPGDYDHASEFVKKVVGETAIHVDRDYLHKVETALVEAVAEAHGNRVPAAAGVGKGMEDKVAFNRRFQMKNGRTYTHPGQLNPEIVKPAGPTDPEVGVIGVWNSDHKLIGCIVNYACHATTNPGGISANYICYLEKAIQGFFGKDVVVVFTAGACGDVTQVDNQNPYQHRSGERWAEFVGGRIGAEAVRVLLSMEPGELTPLATRTKILQLKRRVPSPERVQRCEEIVKQGPEKVGHTDWVFAREILQLDALVAKQPVVDVEVQAVQVGPAVFLTTPAEYFCAFGLQQKARSKFPFTFPVSLANGCVGYVPTEEALGPSGGGYETRLTSYSNLELTAGRQMMEAGIALAGQLQPGPVPVPPAARPGQPWNYGNLPPELR